MNHRLASVIVLCVMSLAANAATDDASTTNNSSRLKVAVVLGGGGAHGVAHLGVLAELERQRVPIDLIVGTGFGGIIGGLYASGMPISEIDNFLFDTDWPDVFNPDTRREDLSFRRKNDDADFLIKYSVGVKDGQAQLPTSLVPSDKLAQLLQSATANTKGVDSFDDLPVPFRTVTMDLLSGDEVVLNSGALDRAMLATLSSPGTFSPVEINERQLITGSLINNLPVNIAREWGADIIIVVDIGVYIRGSDDLSSIFAIDSNNLRPHVGENHSAQLTRADAGNLDDLDSLQRAHGSGSVNQCRRAARHRRLLCCPSYNFPHRSQAKARGRPVREDRRFASLESWPSGIHLLLISTGLRSFPS